MNTTPDNTTSNIRNAPSRPNAVRVSDAVRKHSYFGNLFRRFVDVPMCLVCCNEIMDSILAKYKGTSCTAVDATAVWCEAVDIATSNCELCGALLQEATTILEEV